MSVRSTVVEAATQAGWNITDSYQYDWNCVDIECDGGIDYLNVELLHDGTYVWNDFTHQTKLGTNHDELVQAFKQLLPLRNEELALWIAENRYKQDDDPKKIYNCWMRVASQ